MVYLISRTKSFFLVNRIWIGAPMVGCTATLPVDQITHAKTIIVLQSLLISISCRTLNAGIYSLKEILIRWHVQPLSSAVLTSSSPTGCWCTWVTRSSSPQWRRCWAGWGLGDFSSLESPVTTAQVTDTHTSASYVSHHINGVNAGRKNGTTLWTRCG